MSSDENLNGFAWDNGAENCIRRRRNFLATFPEHKFSYCKSSLAINIAVTMVERQKSSASSSFIIVQTHTHCCVSYQIFIEEFFFGIFFFFFSSFINGKDFYELNREGRKKAFSPSPPSPETFTTNMIIKKLIICCSCVLSSCAPLFWKFFLFHLLCVLAGRWKIENGDLIYLFFALCV